MQNLLHKTAWKKDGGESIMTRLVAREAGHTGQALGAIDDAMQVIGDRHTHDCRSFGRDQRVYRIIAGTEEIIALHHGAHHQGTAEECPSTQYGRSSDSHSS